MALNVLWIRQRKSVWSCQKRHIYDYFFKCFGGAKDMLPPFQAFGWGHGRNGPPGSASGPSPFENRRPPSGGDPGQWTRTCLLIVTTHIRLIHHLWVGSQQSYRNQHNASLPKNVLIHFELKGPLSTFFLLTEVWKMKSRLGGIPLLSPILIRPFGTRAYQGGNLGTRWCPLGL